MAAPGDRRSVWKRLLMRLPLVIVIIAGAWYFQRGGAHEREIVWQLPAVHSDIQKVEIQLHDAKGKLVKREEFFFESGAPSEITQKVRLDDGRYDARIFIQRKDAPAEIEHQPVTISGESTGVRL